MMMGMPKIGCFNRDGCYDACYRRVDHKGAWEMTDMLHLKAIEIIGHSLEASVEGDQNGREKWH